MPVRAYLYDATAPDAQVTPTAQMVADLHELQLLWIDLNDFDETELRQIASLLSLNRESVADLLEPNRRPRLDNYGSYFQLNLRAIQDTDNKYQLVDLQIVLGKNVILTVHREPIGFLASFERRIKGDSALGELDAPAFLAALLDWHITSYFRIVELLETEVDRLDSQALRQHHRRDLLRDLAKLRQRVGFIRRTLTPHREVYAAMARPDFHLLSGSESATHYIRLNERLDRAIETVENARELLVGSFELFTTQLALRTNEVVKVLTLVSVILLPASVIVGIASLLLKSPVYPVGRSGFWEMLGLIALISITTFLIARRRDWI